MDEQAQCMHRGKFKTIIEENGVTIVRCLGCGMFQIKVPAWIDVKEIISPLEKLAELIEDERLDLINETQDEVFGVENKISAFKCPIHSTRLTYVEYREKNEDGKLEDRKKFFCKECNDYVKIKE